MAANSSPMPTRDQMEMWALMVILVLATGLRLFGLNADLWYDEVLTLLNYSRLPAEELAVTFGSLNNHILYSWLSKFSISIFGESAWALRLPAALMGVASIGATWLLVREFTPKHIALFAAFLLAISYHHVWFSQNARGYTGLMLFTTLSCWFVLKALKTRSINVKYLAGYAICVAAGLTTHLSAAFFFLAQGLLVCAVAVWRFRNNRDWRLLAGYIGACVAGIAITLAILIPLLPQILASVDNVRTVSTLGATEAQPDISEWRNPIWTLLETLRSFGALGIVMPLALVLASMGAVKAFKKAPIIVLIYGFSLVLTLAILIALSFRIWPRYFFPHIGILITLFVIGAFTLSDKVGRWLDEASNSKAGPKMLKLGGGALVIGASLVLLAPNYAYPKQSISKPMAYIAQQNTAGDPVLTLGLSSVLFTDYAAPDWQRIGSASALETSMENAQSVWLVSAFPAHFETKHPEVFAFLTDKLHQKPVARFSGTLSGGDIHIWHLVASDAD